MAVPHRPRRRRPGGAAGRAAALLAALAAAGCGATATTPAAPPTASSTPAAGPAPTPSPTPRDRVAALSDDEALSQLVGVAFDGTTMTPGLRHLVVDLKVGCVALFRGNFGDSTGLRRLAGELEALGREAGLPAPLLVTLDEEGGDVSQVVDAGLELPSEAALALRPADEVVRSYAAIGAALRDRGVGLDLAPVADLRTNPADAVIGSRSFGADPARAGALVAAAVRGLHSGGVAATLKHFPGLGGAPGNPHVAVASDPVTLSQWERTSARSFAAGIAAGADAVMTTAVDVPGLDPGGPPALFSRRVVTGLLREQLGFGGVIVTDSLSLGGLGRRYQLPDEAVMALAAGNDLLLLNTDDAHLSEVAVDALRRAVADGRIPEAQVRASAARVLALRDRWQPAAAAG